MLNLWLKWQSRMRTGLQIIAVRCKPSQSAHFVNWMHGECSGASSQCPFSCVRIAPDVRRRRCSSCSGPAVASVAVAAVASVADRRPRVSLCPCRNCKPLQAVAFPCKLLNPSPPLHFEWCPGGEVAKGRTGDGASVRRRSKAIKRRPPLWC
jgi:hypothetical protein